MITPSTRRSPFIFDVLCRPVRKVCEHLTAAEQLLRLATSESPKLLFEVLTVELPRAALFAPALPIAERLVFEARIDRVRPLDGLP